ncbi:MAG: hypothetical protein U9Q07_13390 [Planctomycetota bacterium]|nr:hypothetical protein [Planctomycetota bacterium]
MSTGSIKEVLSETPPEKLIEEEEMIVSEIMDVKSIVVSMPLPRKMFRGNELGPADRIVHKPRDPGANHNIEITLNDETIYVAQFRNGKARIPQKVAEHIRATFPPGRLVVAD